jgi:hypothetical protein
VRAFPIAAVLACAVAATGCGGGGKKAAPRKTVDQVKACFERQGAGVGVLGIADFRPEHVVVTRAGGGDFQVQLKGAKPDAPMAVFVYPSAAQAKAAGDRIAALINRFVPKDQSGVAFVAGNVVGASFTTQPPIAHGSVRRCAS